MKLPRVSIIVPNYNHAEFLIERLESIFNQTFQDFEVILLDDGSVDGSKEIISHYKNHPKVSHFISSKKNSGSPFFQWKKGIDLAKGEYIWIAESDDYCEKNFLEELMKFNFASKEDLGLIYAQTRDVDSKNEVIFDRKKYTADFKPNIWLKSFCISGDRFVNEYLKIRNVIPNASAVIFKRSLSKKAFPAKILDMRLCGDWYFWISLSHQTRVGFVAKYLNYFRNHSGVSRNHFSIDRKKIRLQEEAEIRNLLIQMRIENRFEEIETLYEKWFKLHSLKNIFDKKFYEAKLISTSYIRFVSKFLQEKIS